MQLVASGEGVGDTPVAALIKENKVNTVAPLQPMRRPESSRTASETRVGVEPSELIDISSPRPTQCVQMEACWECRSVSQSGEGVHL